MSSEDLIYEIHDGIIFGDINQQASLPLSPLPKALLLLPTQRNVTLMTGPDTRAANTRFKSWPDHKTDRCECTLAQYSVDQGRENGGESQGLQGKEHRRTPKPLPEHGSSVQSARDNHSIPLVIYLEDHQVPKDPLVQGDACLCFRTLPLVSYHVDNSVRQPKTFVYSFLKQIEELWALGSWRGDGDVKGKPRTGQCGSSQHVFEISL